MPSFDIVSRVDIQEVDNAINQSIKEMQQRYDFRGTRSKIEWDRKDATVVITADDDYKLKAVVDILHGRLARRGISLKALVYGKVEDASGGLKRQTIRIRQGIPTEKAKELVKRIKDLKLKVQAQIQADQIRVSGKKIDDLQTVIQSLKSLDLDINLQFVNMRR